MKRARHADHPLIRVKLKPPLNVSDSSPAERHIMQMLGHLHPVQTTERSQQPTPFESISHRPHVRVCLRFEFGRILDDLAHIAHKLIVHRFVRCPGLTQQRASDFLAPSDLPTPSRRFLPRIIDRQIIETPTHQPQAVIMRMMQPGAGTAFVLDVTNAAVNVRERTTPHGVLFFDAALETAEALMQRGERLDQVRPILDRERHEIALPLWHLFNLSTHLRRCHMHGQHGPHMLTDRTRPQLAPHSGHAPRFPVMLAPNGLPPHRPRAAGPLLRCLRLIPLVTHHRRRHPAAVPLPLPHLRYLLTQGLRFPDLFTIIK